MGINQMKKRRLSSFVRGFLLVVLIMLLGLRLRGFEVWGAKFLELYIAVLAVAGTLYVIAHKGGFRVPHRQFVFSYLLLLSVLVSAFGTLRYGKLVDYTVLLMETVRIVFAILLLWVSYYLIAGFRFHAFLKFGCIIVSIGLNIFFIVRVMQGQGLAVLHLSFVDPNYYASFLLMLIAFLFAILVMEYVKIPGLLLLSILCVLLCLQLIATLSRGALFSLLMLLLYTVFRLILLRGWGKTLRFVLVMMLMGSGIALLIRVYQHTNPMAQHFASWVTRKATLETGRWTRFQSGLDLLLCNTFLGVGPGQARLYLGNVVHNMILETALAGGLIGAVVLCIWLGWTFWRLYSLNNANSRRQPSKKLSVSFGVELGLVAVFIHVMSLNALTLRHLWFLMAVATAIIHAQTPVLRSSVPGRSKVW